MTVKDSLNFIKDYILKNYSQGIPEAFGIAYKGDVKRLIGTVGCFWTSKPAKAMELAYAIGEDEWGKGLVAEASKAVLDYYFKTFDLKRIQARCKAENLPSARVMQKIGMTYEGTLTGAESPRVSETFSENHGSSRSMVSKSTRQDFYHRGKQIWS